MSFYDVRTGDGVGVIFEGPGIYVFEVFRTCFPDYIRMRMIAAPSHWKVHNDEEWGWEINALDEITFNGTPCAVKKWWSVR